MQPDWLEEMMKISGADEQQDDDDDFETYNFIPGIMPSVMPEDESGTDLEALALAEDMTYAVIEEQEILSEQLKD